MKNALVILTAVVAMAACKSADKKTGISGTDTLNKITPELIEKAQKDTANYTTIQWIDSTTRNLGNLKKDETVEVTFRFKNSGDKTLIIESVTASCGCTIPEKPEQPIAPGEEGVIKAKYNGSGSGTISKNVTVIANTKPSIQHTLIFTGNVEEKK
jgi:Protein of unknown function (DUF1573)